MKDLVLPLLVCALAVGALITPWSQNPGCRSAYFLWEVPTRRTPATPTLLSAGMGTIGVLVVALVSMLSVLRRRGLLVVAGAAARGRRRQRRPRAVSPPAEEQHGRIERCRPRGS